jgi:predicted RNA-binding Zn-ribbon protein involved in translation (DUF1610 family)
MNDPMSMKLGMERCISCGHRWIDYEGVREKCYICGSSTIAECLSLLEIRDAINSLRKEDKKYLDKHAKRTVILKQRYREIAELYLQRAQEIYTKIKEHYSKGNLTDKVIDQLILAFRLFSELGLYKPAVSIAYMTGIGYAQRGVEKEVHTIEDLTDLVAARQWFIRLGTKEWEAAVNLHIGQKSMSAISTDSAFLQSMLQVSLWHFYKARDYYFENKNTNMVERVKFDIERATQLLASYTSGASQVEAAKIAAQSTVEHGEKIRRGLETLGRSVQYGLSSLGEHIEACGGSLSRAMQSASLALSSNVSNTMYTIAGTSKFRGRSLDKRMSEVGKLISSSASQVPEDYLQPVKELGAKFALGGSAAANEGASITKESAVSSLSDSIMPEAKKSEEGMKHLDEPTIKLTGTLLDTLVTKGLGKVLEQIGTTEKQKGIF